MKIRYSEIFNSFQGEAGFAGMPTVWLRTFGCNLECNGFGQKDPTDPSSYVLPYQTVELKDFTKLEQVPVFEYGCDSSYSWSERYKHLVHTDTIEDIADKLWEKARELGADNQWLHKDTRQGIQLCITGGEPLLWEKQIVQLLSTMLMEGRAPKQVTIETNGTKSVEKLREFCRSVDIDLFLSISPKLFSVSGEKDAINTQMLADTIYGNWGWLKFVVDGTDRCWDELKQVVDSVGDAVDYSNWTIWVMPVGATKEQQQGSTVAQIANEGMKRGYRIATRNHAYVYGNVIGS